MSFFTFYQNQLGFKAAEINYTYYRLPSENFINKLASKTVKDFIFTFKAYKPGKTKKPLSF